MCSQSARYNQARLRGALAINASVGSPADISFALGVRTSHGQIKRAADVGDYLQTTLKAGVRGTALFTWGHLQPHYDAVLAGKYLAAFAASSSGGSEKPERWPAHGFGVGVGA